MLVDVLAAGNTRRAACLYAGISEDTFARWLDGSAEFAAAITRAEAESEILRVARIMKAGQGSDTQAADWRADAWWLERRCNKAYGKSERIQFVLGDVESLRVLAAVAGEFIEPAMHEAFLKRAYAALAAIGVKMEEHESPSAGDGRAADRVEEPADRT